MQQCKFCPVEKKEPYKCPRCEENYCSIKCFRSEAHSACSENFYKECVKEQLQGKRHEGAPVDTFEEHMEKYVRGEVDELPGAGAGGSTEEGEPLDSDDEEVDQEADDYMKKVLQETVEDYDLDEEELERRLLGMGVGADVEQLMSALSEEEKAAFAQLAEQVHQTQMGLGDSCFRRE